MPCCVELKHMCTIPPPCESPPALTPPPIFCSSQESETSLSRRKNAGNFTPSRCFCVSLLLFDTGLGEGVQGRTGEAIPGTEEGGNSQNHLGIYGRGGATIMTEVGVGRPGK